MHLLTVLLLSTVIGQTHKTEFVKSFHDRYFEELDKVNSALRDYSNISCHDPEFIKIAKKLDEENTYISNMIKNIPVDEEEVNQMHEVESYYGYVQLVDGAVKDQKECLGIK